MRIVLLVLDSAGIGAAPDADAFGDPGANTLQHVLDTSPHLRLPHLASMGLSTLIQMPDPIGKPPLGRAFRCHPQANGKDSLAGHWEMMGITIRQPFPTYPQGFPDHLIEALQKAWGVPLLGNEVASGTEILQRLGERHLHTGHPIVYTSADSVLQVAAHEAVIPLTRLYEWCQQARDLLQGQDRVGRVIARPFTGSPGAFVRSSHRHDWAVAPPFPTVLDLLHAAHVPTLAIGKTGDIFVGRGFDRLQSTENFSEGLQQTAQALKTMEEGFVFTNLVEFDAMWGHRRDPVGYAHGLQVVDDFLPQLWESLRPQDQLWITADHGCDPTYTGTDHTREDVPWLAWGPNIPPGRGGNCIGLGSMGATLAALWMVSWDRASVVAELLPGPLQSIPE